MGNELSHSEPPAAHEPPPGHGPRAGATPTPLRWPHGGKTVYICGSFTHWQKMPMQWRQDSSVHGEWFKMVELTPGTFQYKFIIDGQWRHDHTAPTVLDNLGNVNNCITIHPPPATLSSAASAATGHSADATHGGAGGDCTGAMSSSMSTGDVLGSGSFSAKPANPVASKHRLSSDPYQVGTRGHRGGPSFYGQVVPPREDLLVHHSASLLLPPHLRLQLPHQHGDGVTGPLLVQLLHLFRDFDDNVEIFAMAQRFRDRTITHMLYKPRRPSVGAEGDGRSHTSSGVPGASARSTRRPSEERSAQRVLQSVRLSGSNRHRDENGHEFVSYIVESVLSVHGLQTMLRTERRYKHFHVLDQLLRQQFGPLVPDTLPSKRAFGNLQPGFVEERRVALERYLQQCVALPEIAAATTFCNFVESDEPSHFSQAKSSAELQVLERASTIEGYLLKYGRRVAAWKRRYFVLCGGELRYYYTRELSNPFQPLVVVPLVGEAAVDGAAADAAAGAPVPSSSPAPPFPSTPLVTIELLPSCGLHKRYGFVLHTWQRNWHLAAPTSEERNRWIRELCHAGAQLSSSGAEITASPTLKSQEGTMPVGAGEYDELGEAVEVPAALEGAGATKAGLLWKRGSKMHVSHRAERAEGRPRDWVARHFVLYAERGELAWTRRQEESPDEASGVVPLDCYSGVAESAGPSDSHFGFQLTHASGDSARAFPLAAQTAESREEWSAALAKAITAAQLKEPSVRFDGYSDRLNRTTPVGNANSALSDGTGEEAGLPSPEALAAAVSDVSMNDISAMDES